MKRLTSDEPSTLVKHQTDEESAFHKEPSLLTGKVYGEEKKRAVGLCPSESKIFHMKKELLVAKLKPERTPVIGSGACAPTLRGPFCQLCKSLADVHNGQLQLQTVCQFGARAKSH